MYRIFCESYINFKNDFEHNDSRLRTAEPFKLLTDVEKFKVEKENRTAEYKKLCDLLYYANQNIDRYPRLEAFLWTIESREMMPEYFGEAEIHDMEEQIKLINSFLKLAYW